MPETFKISEDFDLVHFLEKNEWELIDNKGNMKVIMNEREFKALKLTLIRMETGYCGVCGGRASLRTFMEE